MDEIIREASQHMCDVNPPKDKNLAECHKFLGTGVLIKPIASTPATAPPPPPPPMPSLNVTGCLPKAKKQLGTGKVLTPPPLPKPPTGEAPVLQGEEM